MIGNSWDSLLKEDFSKDYFKELTSKLDIEYKNNTIYPRRDEIFNALRYTPYEKVRVFLGAQDPYQTPGFAHGLAFSVNPKVRIPRSLLNIFKELKNDLGYPVPNNGYLKKWADQGVLLLNTVLTVRDNDSNSHAGMGWEILTDKIISLVNDKETPVVFILFGNDAKAKKRLITNPVHLVIEASHPSPPSANRGGFFGVKPFSRANDFLVKNGLEPIDWQIENI